MRRATLGLALCCVSAALFTGCVSSRGPSPDLIAALDSRSDCETRFAAAEKISSIQDRDMAYSQIAFGAVDCRNNEVLMTCINRISNPTLRDDTAYQCATDLTKAGRGLIAATVANAITNSDTRRKALLFIDQTAPEPKPDAK